MRHLCLLLLAYVSLLLDADAGTWSLPVGTAPHFLFLTAAVAVLLCEGAGAIWWAVLIGVLTDSLSRGPIGLNVVLLANLAFFAQIFGTRTLRGSVFPGGAVVWVYVTFASFSSLLLRDLLHGQAIDIAYVAMYAAGRAGGSVLAFLAVMLSWRLAGRIVGFVLPSARVGRDRGTWATRGA